MTHDIRDSKRRLRHALRQTLRAISTETIQASGRRACGQLLGWSDFASIREVVAFSSLPGEVDTRPLIDAVFAAGKRLLLPRILGRDLEFVPAADVEELVVGRYGIFEPPKNRLAREVCLPAILLVPGVAFDVEGGRLGRGAGYYDRALTRLLLNPQRPILIGMGFPLQIVERVPMAPHDVPMDAVLTEKALIWVRAAAESPPIEARTRPRRT